MQQCDGTYEMRVIDAASRMSCGVAHMKQDELWGGWCCRNGYLKRQVEAKQGGVAKRMKMEHQGQAGEADLADADLAAAVVLPVQSVVLLIELCCLQVIARRLAWGASVLGGAAAQRSSQRVC